MSTKIEESIGGDIKIIREILFGEYLKTIYQDIAAIKDEIAQLKNQDQKLEAALQNEENRSREEAKRLEAEEQSQRQELDKRLSEQIVVENRERHSSLEETNQRIEANFNHLQKELEDLFSEHHALHQDLINSLAVALLRYRDQPARDTQETNEVDAAHD